MKGKPTRSEMMMLVTVISAITISAIGQMRKAGVTAWLYTEKTEALRA